jgi:hypothetical protein
MIELSDQPAAVPQLNVVPIKKLFSRLHGGGIVWVIAQKIGGPNKTMTIDPEDIGAIFRHRCRSIGSATSAKLLLPEEAEIWAVTWQRRKGERVPRNRTSAANGGGHSGRCKSSRNLSLSTQARGSEAPNEQFFRDSEAEQAQI